MEFRWSRLGILLGGQGRQGKAFVGYQLLEGFVLLFCVFEGALKNSQ